MNGVHSVIYQFKEKKNTNSFDKVNNGGWLWNKWQRTQKIQQNYLCKTNLLSAFMSAHVICTYVSEEKKQTEMTTKDKHTSFNNNVQINTQNQQLTAQK